MDIKDLNQHYKNKTKEYYGIAYDALSDFIRETENDSLREKATEIQKYICTNTGAITLEQLSKSLKSDEEFENFIAKHGPTFDAKIFRSLVFLQQAFMNENLRRSSEETLKNFGAQIALETQMQRDQVARELRARENQASLIADANIAAMEKYEEQQAPIRKKERKRDIITGWCINTATTLVLGLVLGLFLVLATDVLKTGKTQINNQEIQILEP